MDNTKKYPMLEKMKSVREKSEICGAFLEWLQTKFVMFDKSIPHDDLFYYGIGDFINIERVLADYFDIDLRKVEEEKSEILKCMSEKPRKDG